MPQICWNIFSNKIQIDFFVYIINKWNHLINFSVEKNNDPLFIFNKYNILLMQGPFLFRLKTHFSSQIGIEFKIVIN